MTGMSIHHLGSQFMLTGHRRRSFRYHCPCVRDCGILRQGNQIYLEVWPKLFCAVLLSARYQPRSSWSIPKILYLFSRYYPITYLRYICVSLSFLRRHTLTISVFQQYKHGAYVVYYTLRSDTEQKHPPVCIFQTYPIHASPNM